jgi:hypothetical protein
VGGELDKEVESLSGVIVATVSARLGISDERMAELYEWLADRFPGEVWVHEVLRVIAEEISDDKEKVMLAYIVGYKAGFQDRKKITIRSKQEHATHKTHTRSKHEEETSHEEERG